MHLKTQLKLARTIFLSLVGIQLLNHMDLYITGFYKLMQFKLLSALNFHTSLQNVMMVIYVTGLQAHF